ncbi:MAG: glycoside hydrolase family 5 protein [Bacillota bacterium]
MKRLNFIDFILGLFFIIQFSGFIQAQSSADPFEQNKRLGRGVNIIGYDPIWNSPEAARFKEKHFRLIKEAGLQSVRINLSAFRFMDKETYQLKDNFLKTLDWAVDNALKNELQVILDLHEFQPMSKNPAAKKEMFLAFWRQISDKFSHAPQSVMFEILNEPFGELTDSLWNDYLIEALSIIRQNNPTRTVIIGPGHWNSIFSLEKLQIPENDRNIIVTVHFYLPMSFTHQGAAWAEEFKDKTGVKWLSTDKEKEEMVRDLNIAQRWAQKNHKPLFLGEFGVYDKADMGSRTRYLSFLTKTVEQMGWSWAYWQFDSDFILYNINEDKWNEPVLKALINKESPL